MSNSNFAEHDTTNDSNFFYTSLNRNADETIVLIHGAFGHGDSWNLVMPFLNNYHLLIPDLPRHGRNFQFKLFSLKHSARLIHDLVQAHARNAKAHIVGHSLGAHVGLSVATVYPEIVGSVILSGFAASSGNDKDSKPSLLGSRMPYLYYAEQRLENCIPRSLIRWLMDGMDLEYVDSQTLTPSLCRDMFNSSKTEREYSSSWPGRTLIIAATKSGAVPSFDSPERTAQLVKLGRQMNPATTGVVHKSMRHPWPRQDPELFAEIVKAWIEGREIPLGFEKLP